MDALLARRVDRDRARGSSRLNIQYQPFGGFDMHADGKARMDAMKKQIDRPIGTLLKELDERGLLERTLVSSRRSSAARSPITRRRQRAGWLRRTGDGAN
jgi:hypothetical protein